MRHSQQLDAPKPLTKNTTVMRSRTFVSRPSRLLALPQPIMNLAVSPTRLASPFAGRDTQRRTTPT